MSAKRTKCGIMVLAPSALLVLFALIFTITATFAWFTMSMQSRVRGILFEVTGQEGLMIAVKKWKYLEHTATRKQASRNNVFIDNETDFYYYDGGNRVIIDGKNVFVIDNNYYAYFIDVSGTQSTVDPDFVLTQSGNYYVFMTNANNAQSVLDYRPYNIEEGTNNRYFLSGDVLVEPEDEDFLNEQNMISEAQLAKVCMNDKDATKITDSLTNATTRIDGQNNALSAIELIEKDGNKFISNELSGGHRHTAVIPGIMSSTTAYKYEFDLYFKSSEDKALVLNLDKSYVRSEIELASKTVDAWTELVIDKYTKSEKTKSLYASLGHTTTIPNGEKLYAESKNAIRVGFSDSEGNLIAIWDPNPADGWTENNPQNNLALDFYNYATGTKLNRAPANANLDGDTYLIQNLTQIKADDYRGSIKVTVWLEGYDADCFDSIASQNLNISLFFASPLPENTY